MGFSAPILLRRMSAVLMFVCLVPVIGRAQPAAAPPEKTAAQQTIPAELVLPDSNDIPRRWFFLVSIVNAYPRLERELLIKKYFDPVVNALAPGFDSVKTFSDMRDDGLLCPPQFAVGYLVNHHLALSIHGGYSAGIVHTKSKDLSLSLLPLYTNFEISRSALYLGFDVDYYPLGAVEAREYEGFWDRLRGTKPSLGSRLTWTRAGFDARIRMGLWPVKELIDVKIGQKWDIPSVNFNAGFDIPTGKNSAFAFNAGYNFFQDEKQDFNGPALTFAWRYFFH